MDPAPVLLFVCILSVLLALFVSTAAFDVFGSILWYQSAKIWVIVSTLCFCVGVSGSIFCIIRSAQPYGYTREGLLIFAPQGRDQFLFEGIIVALLTVGCGLSYYLLMLSTKIPISILRHLGVLFFLTVFIILSMQLFSVYCIKTPWYSLRETIPSTVWNYFTSSVKKSSGLMKRLLRLSEIWLFEAKDISSMRKKFDSLILEYFKRVFNSSKK